MRATVRSDKAIEIAPEQAATAVAEATETEATETEATLAAIDRVQVALAQLQFAGRILREQAELLFAQALAIGLIFPGAYNIEFHVSISFRCSNCKSHSI